MEFSRPEHWGGYPFPSPGDLPNSGIKPTSLASPALAGVFFTTMLPGKPNRIYVTEVKYTYVHMGERQNPCFVRYPMN